MKTLITTVPLIDSVNPPAIFSILGACCNTVGCDYDLFDLNLCLYQTLAENDAIELINDLRSGEFRSLANQENFDLVYNKLVNKIEEFAPDFLAISVFTYMSHFSTKYILDKLNSSPRSYKIIIGGLGISSVFSHGSLYKIFADFCFDNKLIDYYIVGEGEIAFMELLKGNVFYPGINNKNNIQITDLNDLPLPTYEKINPSNYYYANEPEVSVTGSRGCVRDCTFCDVNHYWNKYVYKSGKRMAQELFIIWKETGVTKFNFTDSLINGSISSFREFNSELITLKKQYPDFKSKYQGQFICRPIGQLKNSDYEQMAEAGVHTLIVGIESFSDNVRSHMRKKFSNEDIDYHFELCARYNIKNVLLILSGYPTETIHDHQLNLEYLKKYQIYALSRIIYSLNIEPGGLILNPNSGVPLNYMEEELGIQYLNHSSNDTDWISLKNPSLTKKERLRRAVEVLYTAYQLGYKTLHLNQKIDLVEKLYNSLTLSKNLT
jgi:radical SAM superfamily enzyme YgiQ (UPF0313 family)